MTSLGGDVFAHAQADLESINQFNEPLILICDRSAGYKSIGHG